jgi:hypothetical protein
MARTQFLIANCGQLDFVLVHQKQPLGYIGRRPATGKVPDLGSAGYDNRDTSLMKPRYRDRSHSIWPA